MPIVAVTANALPETRDEALAAGMDDLVTKPVSEPTLLKTLHRLLPYPYAERAAKPACAGGNSDRLGQLQAELHDAFRTYVPQYLAALESLDTAPPDKVRA